MTRKTNIALAIGLGLVAIVALQTVLLRAPPGGAPPPATKLDPLTSQDLDAAQALKTIYAQLRNPSSFQLLSVTIAADGTACYEYRAQNGFGGLNVEHAVMAGTVIEAPGTAHFSAHWSRCKRGRDATASVKGLFEHFYRAE